MTPIETIKRLVSDLQYAHVHTSEPGGPSLYRLDLLTSIIEQAENARVLEVSNARAEGASWTRIGQNVGSSRQAAQQRYGTGRTAPAGHDGQLTLSDA